MEYLKELIAQTGKQQEFADKIGVTQACISRWISGKSKPSMQICLRMSKLFNADLHKLRPDIWQSKDN